MVLLKDFEVKVTLRSTNGASLGEALKEYRNPVLPTSSDEWLAERYIEAKPGQEFQIEIYLKSSFKLFAADGLKILLIIDDRTIAFWNYYNEKEIAANISKSKPFILDDVLNTDGKQYSRVTFSFGSLNAGECSQRKMHADGSICNSLQMRLSILTVILPHSKLRRWDVLVSSVVSP